MSKPLDQYMNLQLRLGCITKHLTEPNWRIYMPDLINVLNELSTRQLKNKPGNDLQKVRAALRHENAQKDVEQYPDVCAYWELHGTDYHKQYITSSKSTMPGAESGIPSLLIQRIRDMDPVGKIGGKRAPKSKEVAQANIADLTEQLNTASIQACKVTELTLQLEAAAGEIDVLKQKIAELSNVPTDEEKLQTMAHMLVAVMCIVHKAIQEHGSSSYSRMDDLVAPKVPIVTLYEDMQKVGELPDNVDMYVRECIKTLRPLWPRAVSKTEFVGAKDTEYHGCTMYLPVYKTVMSAAVELPHRHVTPHLMSITKWYREGVLAFIQQHAPDSLDEATKMCDQCNVARDRR